MSKQRIAALASVSALATGVVTAATVAQAAPEPGHAAVAATPAANPLNEQDRTYLHDDAQGNLFEIRAGRLAAHHGKSRAVRAFGRTMVRDHTAAYAALSTTAKAVGVTDLPTAPSAEQRHLISLWRGLGSRAFDRAYIGYEWEDHQLDISEAQDEVKDGSSAAVQQDARASLPTLQAHLSLAQRILMHLKR